MNIYELQLTRQVSYTRTLKIEARDEEEAKKLALKEKCDEFNCDDEDEDDLYVSDITLIKKETKEEREEREERERHEMELETVKNSNFFKELGIE